MIISPPILKPQATQQTDDAWVDSIMPQQPASFGEFPILDNLAWHGGYHLHHTDEGSTASPVRAIADGVIVYTRASSGSPANGAEPLAYKGDVTDNGCVVIQHTTEIGDQVSVTYYSMYMHMKKEASYEGTIRTGQKVYRKQAIGLVGQATHQNMIHFEIICDQENLEKFVGRNTPHLDLTKDGRSTVVYGDIHFYLPKGKAKFYLHPNTNNPPIHMSEVELFVALRFDKGNAILTTRKENAQSVGVYEEVGTQLDAVVDYEYDLYKKATQLATHTVAASAVYELLRFGRILDTSIETSNVSGVEHWHKVNYPGGTGYVNLNDPDSKITKFSDGDFPHWLGWQLVDDDPTPDSQCNSPSLIKWLDANGGGNNTHAELTAALNVSRNQEILSKTICSFPTEWSKSLIDTQYSWLKLPSDALPEQMTEEDYAKFKAHVSALSFWDDITAPATGVLPPVKHWHFHPREFIKQFRRCGWLSATELAQCLPRKCSQGTTSWSVAEQRGKVHHRRMSKLFAKYNASTPQRKIHFLAQIYIETGLLRLVKEGGQGAANPNIPKAQYYAAFYGRGYMQLTWAVNFDGYGKYRNFQNVNTTYTDSRITETSLHVWQDFNPATQQPDRRKWHPRYDPEIIVSDEYSCADSGGYYWVSKTYRGTNNIMRVVDLGLEAKYVGYVSWLVNGGGNGYSDRQEFSRFLHNILDDEPKLTGIQNWMYPLLNGSLTGTFPPGSPPNNQLIRVNYESQTP